MQQRYIIYLHCCLLLLAFCLGTNASGEDSIRVTPLVKAVKSINPSVVNIRGEKASSNPRSGENVVSGMGTGIIIDPRGYILTNYHVVREVTNIKIIFSDNTSATARFIARDASTDLAVIKVDVGRKLPVAKLGTSSDLMLAESVVAIGNAFGYSSTVSQGVISALGRKVPVNETLTYRNLIQTNSDINPGNSGGPLVNVLGEVIGINVAMREEAQSIGFAIPIDDAIRVAATLFRQQTITNISHGLRVDERKENVFITSVAASSAAARAGLKQGDRLLTLAGEEIKHSLDFERLLLARRPYDELKLTYLRDGRSGSAILRLGASTSYRRATARQYATRTLGVNAKDTASEKSGDSSLWDTLGVSFTSVGQEKLASLGVKKFEDYRGGLQVSRVKEGGAIAKKGFRAGDILIGIGNYETIKPKDVVWILANVDTTQKGALDFQLFRGKSRYTGEFPQVDERIASKKESETRR